MSSGLGYESDIERVAGPGFNDSILSGTPDFRLTSPLLESTFNRTIGSPVPIGSASAILDTSFIGTTHIQQSQILRQVTPGVISPVSRSTPNSLRSLSPIEPRSPIIYRDPNTARIAIAQDLLRDLVAVQNGSMSASASLNTTGSVLFNTTASAQWNTSASAPWIVDGSAPWITTPSVLLSTTVEEKVEKPAEAKAEEKVEEKCPEVKVEEKVEEKCPEVKVEEKVEEKCAEIKAEEKVEEKCAEVKAEEKAEEKPAEAKAEEKVEEKPAEVEAAKVEATPNYIENLLSAPVENPNAPIAISSAAIVADPVAMDVTDPARMVATQQLKELAAEHLKIQEADLNAMILLKKENEALHEKIEDKAEALAREHQEAQEALQRKMQADQKAAQYEAENRGREIKKQLEDLREMSKANSGKFIEAQQKVIADYTKLMQKRK